MNKFEYYAPTRIIFGKGTEEQAGQRIKDLGGSRVLLVYGGNSAIKSGLIDRVEKSIKDANLAVLSMGGVVPNPVLSKVREMIKAAIEFKVDFILGVGGGSVLDTAKAVAHGIANIDVDVWDFYCGKAVVKKSTPVGAVLTISAAGSETSNSSVITNDEIEPKSKRGINTDFNRCKFALMNPELTYTLPKNQISAGVADIFMHTSERYFAEVRCNHLSDEFAYGLFKNVIKYGPILLKKPDDYEAASEIMWSGSISHVGITGIGCKGEIPLEGDWSCHQLSMPLSAIYNSTHGAALTAIWGTWARYVLNVDVKRFANFARNVTGVDMENDNEAANAGIRKMEEFFVKLDLPINITDLLGHKINEDELQALADNCSFNDSRQIGSFKRLNRTDMYNIYKAAI